MREKKSENCTYASVGSQAVVYSAWICTFVWLLVDGKYRAFLHPGLWPLLVLGTIICLLFLASLLVPKSMEKHNCKKETSWLQAALLILPLFFLWAVKGRGLSIHAFSKRSLDLVADSALLAESHNTGKATTNAQGTSLDAPGPVPMSGPILANDTQQEAPSSPRVLKKSAKIANKKISSRPRNPVKKAFSRKVSDRSGAKPKAEKRMPIKKVSTETYSAKELLADYLPTSEKPLDVKGIKSATRLSGKKRADTVLLFSKLWYHRSRMERFEGKRFVAEGEAFSGKGVPEGYFLLFRWFISCCAADAEPIGIIVHREAIKNPDKISWVRVEGHLKMQTIEGKSVTYIEADTVKEIPALPPEQQYLTY
ncbi:MAG: hypothetical protein ACMUIP_02910 [bacterium]